MGARLPSFLSYNKGKSNKNKNNKEEEEKPFENDKLYQ